MNTRTRLFFLVCLMSGLDRSIFGQQTPLAIGHEPQLFLDDWIIASTSGLTRALHQPVKKGLIKDERGNDWERGGIYHGNVVCRDRSGRFHMTYRYHWWDPGVRDLSPNIGDDKAHWFRETIGYAYSDDGLHWHKPKLGLIDAPFGLRRIDDFPFEEALGMSRENNLGCPIDFMIDLNAHGSLPDPARRFLLRVVKKDDTHPFAADVEQQMYFARDWPEFAADPNWKQNLTAVQGTLSPRGFRSMAGYDRAAKVWFQVCQDRLGNWIPRNGRDIARFYSPDLVTWYGPELVLPVAADENRDAKDWIEYMDLDAWWVGGPNTGAWLGALAVFHGDRSDPEYQMPTIKNVWRKGTVQARLVLSRDAGKNWQRVGNKSVWLPCHDKDDGYDRLVFPNKPIRVGDELWVYYSAWDGDHLVFRRDGSTWYKDRLRNARTALATLRYNGYVSFDAHDEPGELITKPFVCDGKSLVVNLRAPMGELRVEVRDRQGKPIPGLNLADCHAATGDGVARAVTWRDQASLQEVKGRPIQLRFVLRNAALYSFEIQD
jgi:hypothetical protein